MPGQTHSHSHKARPLPHATGRLRPTCLSPAAQATVTPRPPAPALSLGARALGLRHTTRIWLTEAGSPTTPRDWDTAGVAGPSTPHRGDRATALRSPEQQAKGRYAPGPPHFVARTQPTWSGRARHTEPRRCAARNIRPRGDVPWSSHHSVTRTRPTESGRARHTDLRPYTARSNWPPAVCPQACHKNHVATELSPAHTRTAVHSASALGSKPRHSSSTSSSRPD